MAMQLARKTAAAAPPQPAISRVPRSRLPRRRIERVPRNAEAQILELIDNIYAAAADGAQWSTLLETLAKTTDSETASVTVVDVAAQRGRVEW